MFRISIKDLGTDRLTKDITANVNLLEEAELFAGDECCDILKRDDFRMKSIGDGEYVVTFSGVLVGSFTITKLN